MHFKNGTFGVLTMGSTLGFVYRMIFLEEDHFPDELVGYLEIRAKSSDPQPVFSHLLPEGYKVFDLTNYQADSLLPIALTALNYLKEHGEESFVSIAKATDLLSKSRLRPPRDPEYERLVSMAQHGEITCTRALVFLDLIQPYDLDFCLSFPLDVIEYFAVRIQRREKPGMLVYWNGITFVMSDDYPRYLAYRKQGYDEVPVTILGDFPAHNAKVLQTGGIELFPPIGVFYKDENPNSLTLAAKSWFLDQRLKGSGFASDAVMKLYMLYIGLSRLVQNPETKERELHAFLIANPVALDPNGVYLLSEVRLGNNYRIDLVIQYNLTVKRTLLIELERANLPIFTKSGRFREKVTHAVQQVEDWLRWWHENPNDISAPLDRSILPDGLVVIGRSATLDDDSRRRLLHLNHNRRVKVITYDDLLDQMKALIQSLEALSKQE